MRLVFRVWKRKRTEKGQDTYRSVEGCELALGSAWWIAVEEGRSPQALGVGEREEDKQNGENGRHVANISIDNVYFGL